VLRVACITLDGEIAFPLALRRVVEVLQVELPSVAVLLLFVSTPPPLLGLIPLERGRLGVQRWHVERDRRPGALVRTKPKQWCKFKMAAGIKVAGGPYDDVELEFEFAVDVAAGVFLGVVHREPTDNLPVGGNTGERNRDSSLLAHTHTECILVAG
jgi:hypothetical protein